MEFQTARIELGSHIIIPCPLSFTINADMEIRWFKETECICIYKNRQVTEGRSYKNRIRLLTEKQNRVSLRLQNFRQSDLGDYICRVIDEDTTYETTIRVENKDIFSRFTDAARQAAFAVLIVIIGVVLAAVVKAAESVPAILTVIIVSLIGVGVQAARAVALAEANISFKKIYREWSKQERKKMEISDILTVYLQPYHAETMIQGRLIMELHDKIEQLQAEAEELKKDSLHTQQEIIKLQVTISNHHPPVNQPHGV